MKRTLFALAAGMLLSSAALAQNPTFRLAQREEERGEPEISLGELTPTPSMWLYLQQRRDHLDPMLAVRRKAEFQAEQRQQRIAAMDWYGFSAARPRMAHTPFTSRYASPTWTGSDGYDPFRFTQRRPTFLVQEPEADYTVR